jgi:multiple antibiotic resistance protein
MIVGPGSIATLVVFLQQADGLADHAVYAAVLAAVLAMIGVTLYFAAMIGARLSRTLRTIMSRLMGMILLAISIEMIVAGAVKLLPGLAG